MESLPPARSLWKRMWIYDLPYSCPRCGQGDTLHLHRILHGENNTWACPHCEAKLTLLDTHKWLRLLGLLPFWIAMAAGLSGQRWIMYPLLLLGIGLSLWLRFRHMVVAAMP